MKVMQVIPCLDIAGAEIMCEMLTEALTKQGHQVIVVSLYGIETPITDRMIQRNINVLFLGKKLGPDISVVGKLSKIIKQEEPDIIHTHLYSLKYAWLAVKKAKQPIPIIHTVHSVAKKEAAKADRILKCYLFKSGQVIPVALSKKIQKTVVDEYGLKPEQIPVIFNGIDLSKCLSKDSYVAENQFTILHIGRLMEAKNHANLIAAFKHIHDKYSQCCLQLIGKGELRDDLIELVQRLDLEDAVAFLGEKENVYPYLQNADMFVLPSLYEGMPMTIIEAMATGLPIVASCVGGIPDMIQDSIEGILCTPDADGIAEAIEKMYGDQALREYCGKNAKNSAYQFSAEIMAEEYLRLYQTRGCENNAETD